MEEETTDTRRVHGSRLSRAVQTGAGPDPAFSTVSHPGCRRCWIHFLRQPCGHDFPTTDEAHSQVEWVRCVVEFDFNEDAFLDRSMILAFHCPLSRHGEALANLAAVNDCLADHGLLLRKGTVVDATIIAAPSSTKNRDAARDPKTLRAKKVNQWHFGSTAAKGAGGH